MLPNFYSTQAWVMLCDVKDYEPPSSAEERMALPL